MALIAMFDNGNFVDTVPIGSGIGAEADNTRETLLSFGHSVANYTALDAAGVTTALTGKQIVVMPEFEKAHYIPDEATEAVYQDFVANGGTMVIHGSNGVAAFLNAVFEFSVSRVSLNIPSTKAAAAYANPLFAGSPVTLPDNASVTGLPLATLPAGTRVYYESSNTATLAEIPFGAGRIIFVGWDMFNAAPIGDFDGGWLGAYDAAIDTPLVANRAPDAADDSFTVGEDGAALLTALANDSDPDGNAISLTSVTLLSGLGTASDAGEQISYDPGTAYNYLAAGEQALVTIGYEVSDGKGGTDTAVATVTVLGANDGPAAAADTNAAVEDGSTAGNVLANDTDPDASDVLAVTSVAFGSATAAAGSAIKGAYGTLLLNADGSYSYAADADLLDTLGSASGLSDTFSYTISDGNGGTASSTLTIAVSLANDARTTQGTNKADVIHGDAGGAGAEDTIYGGNGNDRLFGEAGADTLFGGNGDDQLFGGTGRDTLHGENGNDRLAGGEGADTFVFGKGGGFDTIVDFEVGTDRILLGQMSVKDTAFADVDGNGTLDMLLQMNGGSVTLLNVGGDVAVDQLF